MKEKNDQPKISVFDILEKQYIEADNKSEIDFWRPFTKIIIESLEVRSKKGLSQKDLAHLMKTKQSAISRFENMGRKPNYEFLSRLAAALGHSLGITLYGDFMAIVPQEKQSLIKELAEQEEVSTDVYTQNLLDQAIAHIETQEFKASDYLLNSNIISALGVGYLTEESNISGFENEANSNAKLEIATQYDKETQIA